MKESVSLHPHTALHKNRASALAGVPMMRYYHFHLYAVCCLIPLRFPWYEQFLEHPDVWPISTDFHGFVDAFPGLEVSDRAPD